MMMTQEELDENNEPFLVDTWKYFVNAVRWAKKYNLKIVVDLHAAPGSQNGWEHSGRTGDVHWGTGTTIERTLTVMERLSREIKSFEDDPELKGTVIGIDVLNEPTPWSVPGGIATIKSYYEKAYDRIRQHLPKVYVVLSEAFSEPSVWNDFLLPPNYTNVVFDLHTYHCFDEYLRKASYEVHLNVSCFIFANKVTNHVHPTWTGEWSLAYKLPPEWSENEPYPTSMEQKLWLRRFGMAQRRSYSMPRGLGWFFWNFKTENSVMWDYLKGVHGKWLPCSFPATEDSSVCSNVENPTIVQDLYNCQ
jgi:glucan 1,3-beta-glucosidase